MDTSIVEHGKVQILNDGTNLFVNPSWNLGVVSAKYDRVLIANDDIFIESLDAVLNLLLDTLKEGMIIGPSKSCFEQRRESPLEPLAVEVATGDREYGFGVFMAVFKDSYIPIPSALQVWFGDSFLYDRLSPYLLKGVDIVTPMRGTSKQMDLRNQHEKEAKLYVRKYQHR